ncbi:MAG: hypothetical protein PVI90_18525, partial [Desulfobacteraceae bacterium]
MDTNRLIILAMVLAFITNMGLAIGEESSVIGMVEKTDAGLVLTGIEDSYLITSGNLSKMIGKTIKAIGTISKINKH